MIVMRSSMNLLYNFILEDVFGSLVSMSVVLMIRFIAITNSMTEMVQPVTFPLSVLIYDIVVSPTLNLRWMLLKSLLISCCMLSRT